MNSVNLVGRLTADPELRYTNNGDAVASFTIAVRRRFKNQAGEYESDFIRCQAWKKTGEVIAQNFGKGRMIGVSGSWRTGSFEGQDGKRVYTNDCVVENITFTDSNSDSSSPDSSKGGGNINTFGGSQNGSGGQGTHNNDPFANSGQTIDIDDDSLPF
ncbi:ssDNA binding protein [Bacillus phage 000TH010]|uniref:SsDNA binding protein n=1 Tax=Bacillus phage 000TH010 TaxID=2601652 RepID=A0A5P8PHX4_9CAUD|nr:ssDNA binding protein [Bacillus phage 000TH010]QFR56269.1 ssDNA binding protein [Bacillus phage 000TH010]